MTFDSLVKYTEESIGCTKELMNFLSKASQLDLEYSKNLSKLCQTAAASIVSGGDKEKGGGLFRTAGKTESTVDRSSILKSSLWTTYLDLVNAINIDASQKKTVANAISNEIVVPLVNAIKDMETSRKQIVEDEAKATKELQEAYTLLKKTKTALDEATGQHQDITNALLKAQRASNVKEKEIDKLTQKLAQAQEKVEMCKVNYREADDRSRESQTKYYQEQLPEFIFGLYSREEARFRRVHETMCNFVHIKGQLHEFREKRSHMYADRILQCDLAGDMEDVYAEHVQMSSSEGDDITKLPPGVIPNVSVRSLLNPLLTGRLHMKNDDSAVWKPRHFVFMGDRLNVEDSNYNLSSGRLYFFDSEDSLKPRGMLDISQSSVYLVHDSFSEERKHMFVVSSHVVAQTKNAMSNHQKNIYLSCDNADEQKTWVSVMKKYALCCIEEVSAHIAPPCNLGIGVAEPKSDCYSLPISGNYARENVYRRVRNLRLWIQEAKELSSLESTASTADHAVDSGATDMIYNALQISRSLPVICTIIMDDVPIAKTSAKTGSAPFWGEEFLLENLGNCQCELKISISTQKKKDSVIGQVVLKLATLQDSVGGSNHINKKWENWLPIVPTENSHLTGSPALRITAILTDESILPINENIRFLNCLFSKEFAVLKSISRTADKCVSFARDDFSKSLVQVLVATETDIGAFSALLKVEVDSIEDPNTIFRGNTMATKTIDQYMKFIASEYLKNVLSGPVKLVYEKAARQESCEIDPTRIDRLDDDLLKKHQKRLLNLVQVFWDSISNNLDKCPRNLRHTLYNIRSMVVQSFSARFSANQYPSNVQYSAVSGFIFLRFFCPAILNPKLFGICPEVPESSLASRTLTLIAKVIQNLANLSDFHGKEVHMEFCNHWIHFNLDGMKAWILTCASVPPSSDTPMQKLTNFQKPIALGKELNLVYLTILNNIPEIKEYAFNLKAAEEGSHGVSSYGPHVHSASLLYLIDEVNEMQLVHSQYYKDWTSKIEHISKLQHIVKPFSLASMASFGGNNNNFNTLKPKSRGFTALTMRRHLAPSQSNQTIGSDSSSTNSPKNIELLSMKDLGSDRIVLDTAAYSGLLIANSVSKDIHQATSTTHDMWAKHGSMNSTTLSRRAMSQGEQSKDNLAISVSNEEAMKAYKQLQTQKSKELLFSNAPAASPSASSTGYQTPKEDDGNDLLLKFGPGSGNAHQISKESTSKNTSPTEPVAASTFVSPSAVHSKVVKTNVPNANANDALVKGALVTGSTLSRRAVSQGAYSKDNLSGPSANPADLLAKWSGQPATQQSTGNLLNGSQTITLSRKSTMPGSQGGQNSKEDLASASAAASKLIARWSAQSAQLSASNLHNIVTSNNEALEHRRPSSQGALQNEVENSLQEALDHKMNEFESQSQHSTLTRSSHIHLRSKGVSSPVSSATQLPSAKSVQRQTATSISSEQGHKNETVSNSKTGRPKSLTSDSK